MTSGDQGMVDRLPNLWPALQPPGTDLGTPAPPAPIPASTQVKLEQGDASGSMAVSQTHKDITVELCRESNGGLTLRLGLRARPLALPCRPPLAVYAGALDQGRLGLRFHAVKLGGIARSVQLSLVCEDVVALRTLWRHVTLALTGGAAATHPGAAATGAATGVGKAKTLPSRRPLGCVTNTAHLVGGARGCSSGLGRQRLSGDDCASGRGEAEAALSGASAPQQTVRPREPSGLSAEQEQAVELVRRKRNVFLTGGAGTGKSRVLQTLISELPPDTTFVTASTGLAASALGGTTLHAFAGVGGGEGSVAELAARAGRGDSAQRWRRAAVLVVDEVSMLDARLFEGLEEIARKLRGDPRPFGGIQLVLSGDFHQLPPVTKRGEPRRFCFQSQAWARCVQDCVLLTGVYRQAGDDGFIDLLGRLREGAAGPTELRRLCERCSVSQPLAIRGPGTDDADQDSMRDAVHSTESADAAHWARPSISSSSSASRAASSSTTASTAAEIQATRLYTHRADVDAVNATALAALPGPGHLFRAMDEGEATALAGACPARAALELRVGAQVLLLRTLSARSGLVNGARGVVTGFTPGAGLPIVQFLNGRRLTVARERWEIRVGGRVLAARAALPLDLAWALSVHRCQGMTLDAAMIDLSRAFEPGMAYVALSRVKSTAGLRIAQGGMAPAALRADPVVLEFYRGLKAAQADRGMEKHLLEKTNTCAEHNLDTEAASPLRIHSPALKRVKHPLVQVR